MPAPLSCFRLAPPELSAVISVLYSMTLVHALSMGLVKEYNGMMASVQVLERGERIEVLVDKTEDLQNQAQRFQVQGRNLRNKMWWQVRPAPAPLLRP